MHKAGWNGVPRRAVQAVRTFSWSRYAAAILFGMALAACGGGSSGADTSAAGMPLPAAAGAGNNGGTSPPAATPASQPGAQTPVQPANEPARALGPAARFNAPDGIAVHVNGDLYVVDAGNATIRKISAEGEVSTLAGSPGVLGSADGQGAAAQFRNPRGIAVDADGNLYVADTGNHTIRRITPAGMVSTLAGAAGMPGLADGGGMQARFNQPSGVAVDAARNVYVADTGNFLIRRIAPDGTVTTHAGGARGFTDGDRSTASFLNPLAIAVDTDGNLYITDSFMLPSPINARDLTLVRRVTPAGEVSTLAGGFVPENRSLTDGTGSVARFLDAAGIAVNPVDRLVYVADSGHHAVRRVTLAGVVTTLVLAGPDGAPPHLEFPRGIAADGTGNLFLADTGNHVIRKIAPDGRTSIVAGREGEIGSNDRAFEEG